MNTTQIILNANGNIITLSAQTDARISRIEYQNVVCKTVQGARELAGELSAWGLKHFVREGKAICW